jgi:tetratricopeptide (TPR) repeat protein
MKQKIPPMFKLKLKTIIIILLSLICCNADAQHYAPHYAQYNASQNNLPPYKREAMAWEALAERVYTRYNQIDDSIWHALYYINRAIAKDPWNYSFYNIKSHMQCSLGMTDSAIRTLNASLKFFPDMLPPRMQKAQLLEKAGNEQGATEVYTDLLDRYNKLEVQYPDSIGLFLNKAIIQVFMNNEREGRKEYDALKKRYPDNRLIEGASIWFDHFDKAKFVDHMCSAGSGLKLNTVHK